MVVDFALPSPGQGLLDAIQMWSNKSTRANCDYSYHMAITWWGEQVFNEMETVVKDHGITTFKHFMAYKGALMVNDDEMFASFQRCKELGALPLVHAENGDVVADLQARLLAEGNDGPEAHAYSRPPAVEGEATNRAITIADMGGVPINALHVSREDSHKTTRPARSATSSIRTASGTASRPGRCRSSPPITAPSPPNRNAMASATSPRSPTAPAGWRTGCRCSGPMAWRPGG